jgi:transcription elongation GreA/GreB family factor
MNKKHILQQIIETLQQDFTALQTAVDLARDAATHEESKAENKYDTRGLEASYLAHGQAQRAAEIAMALEGYQRLSETELPQCDQVLLSALVGLEDGDGVFRWLWLGAEAGGLKVVVDDQEITLLTPQSPLGQVLMGKVVDDEVFVEIRDERVEYVLVSVC